MIDITRSITTVTVSFFWYIAVIMFSYYKCNIACIYKTKPLISTSQIYKFVFFIFALFPFFAPDYYGHHLVVSVTKQYGSEKSHVEPIYNLLMDFTDYDYLLFRLCIIVPGYIILNKIINKFSLYTPLTWYLIGIFFLFPMSNIIRSSLADIIGLTGIFYYYRNRSLSHLFLCLMLLGIALVFHKSAFMLFVPFILSLKTLNKSVFKIIFICLPIIIMLGRVMILLIANTFFLDNSFMQEGDFILSKRILSYLTIIVNLLLFTYIVHKGKILLPSKTFNGYIYRLFFYAYLIWICLLLVGVSHYVPARFITHFYIVIAFLLTFLIMNLKIRRQLFICLSIYVANMILSSIMSLRDCYLQMLASDIMGLK